MVAQQNVKLYMVDFVLPEFAYPFVTNVTDKKNLSSDIQRTFC